MTIHWPRPVPGWALFGLLMALFLCYIFFPTDSKPLSKYDSESVLGQTENVSHINDTLPHYQYQRIKDSLTLLEKKTDFFYNHRGGSGIEWAHLGFFNYDTGKDDVYFLTLSGYDHDDFVSVKNENSGSVLSYPVWDKVENRARNGHTESKAIGIKYEEGKERWQGKVFIPVTKTFAQILSVVFYAFLILVGIVCFYVVLFIPLRFLHQLAKGKAFTEENIGSLYLTGWGLIGVGLLLTLSTFLVHLLLRSKIPDELTFSYYAVFMDSGKYFMAGLSVLLLARAFLQGLELKEEQDLTV